MKQIYIDPIAKKYVDLIKSKTNRFRRIYYRDPVRIGASELPVLIIEKLSTDSFKFDIYNDRHDLHYRLTIVTDIRNTISDDATLVPGMSELEDLMEGRLDDGTFMLKPDSLTDILRHNLDLDATHNLRTDLGKITRAQYGMTSGKRQPDAIAVEGTIDFVATFVQVR